MAAYAPGLTDNVQRLCWMYAYRLRIYAYRLLEYKRIDGGPRFVPPKELSEAPADAVPEATAAAVPSSEW